MRSSCLCLLLFLVLTLPVLADVTITEHASSDGNRTITLENAAVALTVNPAKGGRISSFIWKKTGHDWVLAGNAGMLLDHVWQQTWPGELIDKPYEIKLLENGPRRGVIQVSVVIEGKNDPSIQGVKLIRTIALSGDSPRVEVTIRLENPTAEPRAPGLWVQNVINVGSQRDGVWSWRPSAHGTIRASFDTKSGLPCPAAIKMISSLIPLPAGARKPARQPVKGLCFCRITTIYAACTTTPDHSRWNGGTSNRACLPGNPSPRNSPSGRSRG